MSDAPDASGRTGPDQNPPRGRRSAPAAEAATEVTPKTVLRAKDVVKQFPVSGGLLRGRIVHAVDGVSLDIRAGETLGVVGESGCGKSTLGRCLVRLSDVTSGTIEFDGRDITTLSRRRLRPIRRGLQLVFQDPYASLNPRDRVRATSSPSRCASTPTATRRRSANAWSDLFEVVGLSRQHLDRYPHEFSGGQRQRIGIARALAMNPKLIVADEPVSALDVSIQAQVLNLFADLQDEFGLTYVFIAHDLGGGPARLGPHRGDVSRARSSSWPPPRTSTPDPPTPTPRRCCRRCPTSTTAPPPRGANASCSPATCPARSTSPPAARSTPAAATPRTSAAPNAPRSPRFPPACWPPAISLSPGRPKGEQWRLLAEVAARCDRRRRGRPARGDLA